MELVSPNQTRRERPDSAEMSASQAMRRVLLALRIRKTLRMSWRAAWIFAAGR
jgi:hypothetical protein